MAKLQEFIST